MAAVVPLQPDVAQQLLAPEPFPKDPMEPTPALGPTISESTLGMSTTTTVMVTINLAASVPMSEMEVVGTTLPACQEPSCPSVHTSFGRSSKAYTCFM